MNIVDQLQQNPLIAVILVVVPAIGIAWKVFHSLYVSPRDFKIGSLKDDMKKLQEELIQLRKAQERSLSPGPQLKPAKTTPESESAKPTASKPSPIIPQANAASESPLTSLRVCYARWSDETLTKLQKQKFEADLLGNEVPWIVHVDSVSEAEHQTIHLYVREPIEHWDVPRAAAEFPATQQDVLLGLKKGDRVLLQGEIKDFFLWPRLTNCRIEKPDS